MRSVLFSIAFLIVALFPSIASANDPAQPAPPAAPPQNPAPPTPPAAPQPTPLLLPSQIDPQQIEKFFRHFDGNKDGQLDATERLAIQGALEQIKQNPDFAKQLIKQMNQPQPEPFVERYELNAIPRPEVVPIKAKTLEDKILKYLDKDGDGVLGPQEKAAAKFTKKNSAKTVDDNSTPDDKKGQGRKVRTDEKNANPQENGKGRSSQNRNEKQTESPSREPGRTGNGPGKPSRPEKPNKKDVKKGTEKNAEGTNKEEKDQDEKDNVADKNNKDRRPGTSDKHTNSRKPTEKRQQEQTTRSKNERDQKQNQNRFTTGEKTPNKPPQLADGRNRKSDHTGPSHKSSGPKNGR